MVGVFELVVEGDEVVPHAVAIGRQPFSIGRGPGNDLVVSDGMVSWEHLKVWSDRGQLWLSDAGSTNGTYVNGSRITGTVQVGAGDRITVGTALRLQVKANGAPLAKASKSGVLAIEAVSTGHKYPFRSERFTVGSAPDADLRIPGAPAWAAEFAAHEGDEYWVMIDEEERQLELGSEVEIHGIRFRLVEVSGSRAPTINPQPDRFPYKLTATLDSPIGPVAALTDLGTGTTYRVEAETRAILLYLLGTRVADDRAKGVPRDELGWTSDDEVIVGVWGRSGLPDGANRLKVLVHRLRAEVKKAGFDPWFIERRKRFIRVRVREFSNS